MKRLAFEQGAEFNLLAIELIKDYNRELCKKRKKPFGVNEPVLDEILRRDIRNRSDVSQFDAIYRRAANIAAFVFKKRPFKSLNRDMAFIIAESYLGANGIRIDDEKASKILLTLRNNKHKTAQEISDSIKQLF